MLLAVGGFLAGPLSVRAATVYLEKIMDTYQVEAAITPPATALTGTRTSYVRNVFDYTKWVGMTFTSHQYDYTPYVYTEGNGATIAESSPDFSSYALTNKVTSDWVGEGLATGVEEYGTVRKDSYWVPDGCGFTTYLDVIPGGYTNSWSPWAAPNPGYFVGRSYSYTETNEVSVGEFNVTTSSYSTVSTVKLITDGTNSANSFLYRIKSNFDISGYPSGSAVVDYAGAYQFAELYADTNGYVWKVLADNTTNEMNLSIDEAFLPIITNFVFQPIAMPATLSIQWKGATSTNWSSDSGPVFVLPGTTVDFRVLATVDGTVATNVDWPTDLPTWSNTSNGPQTSITFDTVSSTTTGQCVTVTAGSMASVQVVVFDYDVKFKPETAGAFPGRPTFTTRFGVGENVDFVADILPVGLTTNEIGALGWSVTGMSTQLPEEDQSKTNAASVRLGAFRETNTVVGALMSGICTDASRTNTFDVVRPTNAVLKDMWLWDSATTTLYTNGFLYAWTNVGHVSNVASCAKKATYFLEPVDVSFHGIVAREGGGPYYWVGAPPGGSTNVTFTLTNASGSNVAVFQATLPGITNSHTPTATFKSVSHPVLMPDQTVQPNWFLNDSFSGYYPSIQPVLTPHVPIIIGTRIAEIDIEFALHEAIYLIDSTNVISRRDVYSDGTVTIKKAGSGPHTKAFGDPFSPR